MTKLWRAIEESPLLMDVKDVWRERLGKEFEPLSRFLEATNIVATRDSLNWLPKNRFCQLKMQLLPPSRTQFRGCSRDSVWSGSVGWACFGSHQPGYVRKSVSTLRFRDRDVRPPFEAQLSRTRLPLLD